MPRLALDKRIQRPVSLSQLQWFQKTFCNRPVEKTLEVLSRNGVTNCLLKGTVVGPPDIRCGFSSRRSW